MIPFYRSTLAAISFAILLIFGLDLVLSRRPGVSYRSPDRDLVRQEVRLEMQRQMSVTVAREQYPDLTIPGSALLEAVQAREQEAREAGDVALDDPNFPLIITETEASRLGIKPSPTPRILLK